MRTIADACSTTPSILLHANDSLPASMLCKPLTGSRKRQHTAQYMYLDAELCICDEL